MKGQPFELACRGGSLLISEARVMRRGTTAWALWRSQIIGVGCVCPDTADDATVYLHLRDGRRFAAEEVAARECFRLFEMLGYEAEPEADAAERPDDAPLVIDLGDHHMRAVASAQSVTLNQDETPLWVVPRNQLLGVRVTAGPAAAAVQIMARNGGATLLENVPFAAALRLLVAIGAAPAELAPLAAPAASALASVPAPAPSAMTNPVTDSSAEVPAPAKTGPTAAPPRPSGASALGVPSPSPAPSPALATGAPGIEPARPEPSTQAPRQPAGRTRAPAESLAMSSSVRPDAPHAAAPSAAGGASGTRPSTHTRDAAARLATPASASMPVTPIAASAGAGAATRRPRPQTLARPLAPPVSPATALATEHQTHRDERLEEAQVSSAPAEQHDAVGEAWTSARPTGDGVTVRQAALLLWHAALVAVALRLAGIRHTIASPLRHIGALRRIGALRLPHGARARTAALLPAHEMAHAHPLPLPRWRMPLVALYAVYEGLLRTAQSARHQVGSQAAAIGAAVRSAPAAAHGHTPSLAARAFARGLVTRSRVGVRALPSIAAVRWRQFALVAALALVVLALPTAGDALVAHLAPSAHSGTVISHQTGVAPEQAEKARPSRAVVPPAVPAGVVYAGSQDGAIYALDAHTGALVWRYDVGSPVEGGPSVVDGVIYAGEADGSIVALSAAMHRELWRYHTDGSVRGAPIVAGGVVYAGSSDHQLYALRASDGMLLWRFRAGDWFASTPAVSGNMVYAGSYDGTLYALRASDGAEVWHLTTPGAVVVAPMVAGGIVYAGSSDNAIYALDARTGAIRWWYTTGGSIYAAPVVEGGVVYVGSCDTNLYALRAGDGTLLWRALAGGLVLAPAVVDGQTVYVGTADGRLDALRTSDGTQRWSRATKAASAIVPAVADGAVYADSGDSSVFALDAQDGSVRWSYHTNGRIASSPTVVAAS